MGKLYIFSPDVDLYDYVKDEVGFRLADRIFDIKRELKLVADFGCNRGFVSRHIVADTVGQLILCDTSPSMLEQATGTPGLYVTKRLIENEWPQVGTKVFHPMHTHIYSDSQTLPFQFEQNTFDLIVSSLSLHWINDLPGCFSAVMQSLKPDGVFIASMFGGETLYELRSALQLAEIERKGGLSPHISPFTQVKYRHLVECGPHIHIVLLNRFETLDHC